MSALQIENEVKNNIALKHVIIVT